MIDRLYETYGFNIKEDGKMKTARQEMFVELSVTIIVVAGLMTAGHFLKPWAIAQLSAGLYVIGLFVMWAKTR